MPIEYKTIQKDIYLQPKFLDKNITKHIYNELSKVMTNNCCKQFGYILDIKEIIHIDENFITNTDSKIIFKVEFIARVLKPIKGDILSGIVCMVYDEGIFFDFQNKQKILIPKSNLEENGFVFTDSFYKKGDEIIEEGSKISAMIVASQYSKKKFSCFGSLVIA